MIAERFGYLPEEIRPETNLMKDLSADSLDFVEMVMQMEDHFGLSAPDEDVEGIRTVGDIIAYVKRRLGDDGACVGAKIL